MMPVILGLLADAYVSVDESEVDTYAKYVPDEKLMPHPRLKNLASIRNWILDNSPERAVVQADDDLQGIYSMIWRTPKRITNPNDVRAIIENGVSLAHDLNKTVVSWGRIRMLVAGNSPCARPYALTSLFASTHVNYGHRLRFDEDINCHEDIDFTLQVLLKDRVVISDQRYWFDHGSIEGIGGGMQSFRNSPTITEAKAALKSKWRRHINLEGKPMYASVTPRGAKQKSRQTTKALRIQVRRKSNLSVS